MPFNLHPKAISATTVAALVTIAAAVLAAHGHPWSQEVQGAVTTVAVAVAAWVAPSPAAAASVA